MVLEPELLFRGGSQKPIRKKSNIQNNSTLSGNNLYNGNIGHMFTAIAPLTSGGQDPQIMVYDYDQLNRITASAKLGALVDASNNVGSAGLSDAYRTAYKYDYNGNITELERYDDQGTLMDDLIYHYKNDHQGSAINQLKHVTEQVVGSSQSEDLEPMSQGNYSYNAIGQLIGDASEEIGEIIWNNAAKVRHIKRTTGSTKPDLEFVYGPMGNRIIKIVKPKDAGGNLEGQDQWTYTYYLRDAQGNVMATYERSWNVVSAGLQSEEYYTLNEHHLYGSDRLGLQKYDQQLSQTIVDYTGFTSDGYFNNPDYDPLNITLTTSSEIHHIDQGDKYYECKNHLGNVLVVISDRNLPVDAGTDGYWEYFQADIVSYSDYYPFGSLQPRRHHQSPEYRYGFQGQEKDDEVKGTGNSVNYKYRMHDPRLGRFFAVDPLTAKYPWYSPYQFSGNKVIQFVELEGLEEGFSTMHMVRNWERQDRLYDEGKISKDEYFAMRTRSQMALGIGGIAGTVGMLVIEAAAAAAPALEAVTWRSIAYAASPEGMIVGAESASFVANVLYDGPDDPFPTPGPGGEMGKAINKAIKPISSIVSERMNLAKLWKVATDYIDFDKAVFTKTIKEGTELVQYRVKGTEGTFGNYYALPGTKPESIGLDPNDIVETYTVTVKKDTKVLVSTHKTDSPYYKDHSVTVEGGGQQMFSRDLKENASFEKKDD